MRRIFFILILTFSCNLLISLGQEPQRDAQVVQERLFARISADISDSEKLKANDSIRTLIESYAVSDSVFVHKFSNLRYLGQITSKDSRLKIISWNLLLKDSASRYYCYFIHNNREENKVCKLSSEYKREPVRKDTTYSGDNWYGALYYDLRPVKRGNQVFWMLLGIDYGNPAVTRKIIDVLSFDPEGKPVFGKKWFETGKMTGFREVLEYGYTAVISLRFLTDKLIVFDHLVPVSPEYENNREFYGPDYSYDAYRFEKGVWKLKINLDVRNEKE
jgi:hypothetical protein